MKPRLSLRKVRQWIRERFFRLAAVLGRFSVRWGPAIGFYSALTEGGATVVAQGQDLLPAGPDSLRVLCGHNQNGRQPWPIFWARIPEARLVGPSLAVLNARKRLMVEGVFGRADSSGDPSLSYLHLPSPVRLEGAWTSVISRWCRWGNCGYFHWLIDGLSRLKLLDRFPTGTRILIPGPLHPYQVELLEMLGLSDRCRPTPEIHLEVGEYYHSSATAMSGCDNPYAIRFLRDCFLDKADASVPRHEKIYLSRLQANRSAPNETELIDFVRDEGWFVMEAERYSLRQQIAIFQNARAICGIHGAGFTNVLWCQPGCQMLEFCADNYLNGCYEGIASYVGVEHRYLVFPGDKECRVLLDLPAAKAALRALA